MPVYEYQCPDCNEQFEKLVRFSAPAEVRCPHCGGERPRRLLSLFASTSSSGDTSSSYSSSACATST